jgi:hypothetical protein
MGRLERHDSRSWRARAEECRALAELFIQPETRRKMLALAADYDHMADRAERISESDASANYQPG